MKQYIIDMDISQYNTLLQLSVGLNIACIAMYKTTAFGQIIETHFTRTSSLINERVDAIRQKMLIGQTSLETTKNKSNNNEVIAMANEMLRIYHSVETAIAPERISQLNNEIDRDYTPKCMSGIATFCTLYAIFQLIIILVDQVGPKTDSVFLIYALICCIPIVVFILAKMLYMHPLYARMRETKISYKELRKRYIEQKKQTNNPIKCIWYGINICHFERQILRGLKSIRLGDDIPEKKRKEKLYSLSNGICKFLSVRMAVTLITVCLIISIVLSLYINLPSTAIFIGKYIAVLVAYMPFFIYAYVLYVYERHRQDIINDYFTESENTLQTNEPTYRFISEYTKKNRSTIFTYESCTEGSDSDDTH